MSRSWGKIEFIALLYPSISFLIAILSSYFTFPLLTYLCKADDSSYKFTVSSSQCRQQAPTIILIPQIHYNVISDTIIQITTTRLPFL